MSGFLTLEVLSPTECAQVCAEVHRLRHDWVERGGGRFHTLGTAAYLDATASGSAAYYQAASRSNVALDAAFAPLYGRIAAALGDAVGEPVTYARGAARPGFHVFAGHQVPVGDSASIHFDVQDEALDWRAEGTDVDHRRVLSFTLPVALPAAGGGLRVWDVDEPEAATAPQPIAELCSTRPSRHLPYRIGEMVVVFGRPLHQIAGVDAAGDTDERITCQGHGLFCDGAWRLYW